MLFLIAKDTAQQVTEKVKEIGGLCCRLLYMQARYYDPVIGRFYSNDPVGTLGHLSQGNIQGFNRYAYGNNNPYKYTDPDGRAAVCLIPGPMQACAAAAVAAISGLIMMNESSYKLGEVLEGASKGEETKGRTTNWDKLGGMNEADSDFDNLVDPDSIVPITDSKGGDGRRGIMNDGSGRGINIRPNSSDGRPSEEIQDGKDKIKIRYGEKEEK